MWLRGIVVLLLCCTLGWAQQARRVHIAVFGLFHPQRLEVEAKSRLVMIEAGPVEYALSPSSAHVVSLSRDGNIVVVRGGDRVVRASRVRVLSKDGGDARFVLSVPEKIRREYVGELMLTVSGKELVPVVAMDREIAVASIVAAEMPADTSLEALKAQAVVTRSYLVAGGPRHAHADFCDTTHCQFLKGPPSVSSSAWKAARATAGLVLTWNEKPLAAMFSASCGGRTNSLREIGYEPRDYPYFPVDCPYCQRSPEHWARTLPARAMKTLSGNESQRIRAVREMGWSAVPSNTFRTHTGTNGETELTGTGRGHGVGLCQRGAAAMAREGKDFRAILDHYYPNTTLKMLEQ